MGDESEWKNLPAEEKVQHSAWRARVAGYEELIKLFQTLTDDKSPEFSKYLGLVKKFVADSNVVAQEKGLEATLKFVENYQHSGRAAGEVCSGIVAKCLNQKPKIKRLGMDVLMAFIEAEKQDVVQEELLKGLTNKQPKVVAACVESLREALRDFGTKIVPIKPILKQLQTLLEDRDKTVREETKQLAIEIYRWIGAALKPQLTNLKPVQVSELEAEFEKIPPSKPQQTRFLRSQQDLRAQMLERAAAAPEAAEDGADSAAPAMEEVDAYELLEPVDILSKLPKDFYDKIEEKKWQERKEALEAVEKLASAPKLEQGDYNDLVRALKKVVTKDTNVMLVALAAKCITLLATGLRKKFSPHAVGCIDSLIEKFKEKKTNVVSELKNAVDACFLATNLEAISEICIAALDHKTPSVKAETTSFLARCFCKCTVVTLPKKLLKPFVTALLKTANDTSPEVREASFEALGTAMKVVTEKAIAPFLTEVDSIKMAKIKECCEKASTVGKPGTGGQSQVEGAKPSAAPPSAAATTKSKDPPKKSESAPVSASSSSTSVAGAKKKAVVSAKGKKSAAIKEEVMERELSDEAVEEKMMSLFPGDALQGLASANWKDRLGSMEKMAEVLKTLSKVDIPVQAFVRTIVKKPGLKDNNFQVLKLKVDMIGTLAQRGNFSKRSAEYCLGDLVDKIGDVKNGSAVQDCLLNMAEATSLEFIAPQVLSSAFEQKNPKNQSEAINWLCKALTLFGLKVNVKGLIETINKALASANPAVRTSGISLLGVIYLYMGQTLRVFFENEKPALLQQIDAEFEKVKDQKPPAPTRGLKPTDNDAGGDEDGDGGDDNDGPVELNVADLVPRVDISDKITDALLTELSDKNWKVRKEALEKVQKIISEAKFITPSIGSLPESIKQRLNDSNKILVSMTISLCDQLTTSMGPSIKQHVRIIAPGLFSNFGDSKPNVRKSAVDTINKMVELIGPTGLATVMEGEVLLDALKIENPTQRAELLGWLAEKLPGSKKLPAEFQECVPILYACLEDRNAEVRKKANEAVLPFMIHCGFDTMLQKLSLVKPVSKDLVMKALEQARPNLPAKPGKSASAGQVSTGQHQAPGKAVGAAKTAAASAMAEVDGDGPGSVAVPQSAASKNKAAKPGGVPATAQKKSSTTSVTSAAAAKKKQAEEEDNSPPIKTSTESAKEQRFKDEKNLKVLKWNFDVPRREFLDQLRSQMEPHFSRTIVDQLFHADFKQHIKAIDTLIKVCEEGLESTRANLDLILKWFTLRFFDTNTTVLLKCLEYLVLVFGKLADANYHMDDIEATNFLPYLINKIGDPKDNIRKDIRKIIQLILPVYCSSRVSFFLLEGLKSKNAKQRTECLEELGNLIQQYGMERFQPSMTVALKAIAQQIGDRDNSVRSAALNTIVEAYVMHGEGIFRFIGNLNEKDMSMLEERIKRSSRTKPGGTGAGQPTHLGIPAGGPPQKQNSPEEKPKHAKIASAPAGIPRAAEARPVPLKGPFQLDFDGSDTESDIPMPQLIEPDLRNLDDPINLPVARYKTLTNNRRNPSVALLVAQVGSSDIDKCIQALQEIEAMLKDGKRSSALQAQNEQTTDPISASDKSESLRGHVDALLSACTLQLRLMHGQQIAQETVGCDSMRLYKFILGAIMSLCRCKNLSIEASKNVIKDLTQVLLMILLDPKLNLTPEGEGVAKAVNITVVKVVENMNANNVMVALVQLLHEIVGNEEFSPQFKELVMKCLWKMTRMIPNIVNQLDLDQIVGDIHAFLVAYPSPTWNKNNDMPLRTLKTILHAFIKQKGDVILDHLSLVREKGSSEVEQYIRRVLKSMPAQGESSENAFTDSINSNTSLGSRADQQELGAHRSPRISKAVQDSLAKIFQKIGCKDNTTEGLNDLYDFKLRHPDADLEPFLKRSSPFFQDYINKGLKTIEAERQQTRVSNGPSIRNQVPATQGSSQQAGHSVQVAGANLPPADFDLSAQQYLERLKLLRAKCGLDNSDFHISISKPSMSSLDSQSSPGLRVGGDETPSKTSETFTPFSISSKGANPKMSGDVSQAQGDSAAIGPNSQPNSDIDELKKRLERIRNAKRE